MTTFSVARPVRIVRLLSAALAASALIPATASAAVLSSPANGAVVNGPTVNFQWALDAGETPYSLMDANYSNIVNGTGFNFLSGRSDIYNTISLSDGATSVVSGPLYAGKHYWGVRTAAAGAFNLAVTGPSQYTVRPLLKMGKPTMAIDRKRTKVTILWPTTTNAKTYNYTVVIKRNGKRISRKTFSEISRDTTIYKTYKVGATLTQFGTSYPRGTRFSADITLRGGGLTRKATVKKTV